jgi:hypothetical protein
MSARRELQAMLSAPRSHASAVDMRNSAAPTLGVGRSRSAGSQLPSREDHYPHPRMTHALGIFSYLDHGFASLLWRLGAGPYRAETFPARNFLLDERVPRVRAGAYLRSGGPLTLVEWQATHREYEVDRLRIPPSVGHLPHAAGYVDPMDCPESFVVEPNDDFIAAHSGLDLVRVESITTLAASLTSSPEAVLEQLSRFLDDGRPADKAIWLAGVLDVHARRLPQRPVFAGFLEDVQHAFEPGLAVSDMLAELRDRFGLAHYDPDVVGPVPLAVFRYPVSAVPRIVGAMDPLLAAPTVLESGMSAAFLPSPAGSRLGTAVDLSATSRTPAREVIHLAFRYRPDHLVAVGEVTDPPAVDLKAARARHLRTLAALGAGDYGTATDTDLVRSP